MPKATMHLCCLTMQHYLTDLIGAADVLTYGVCLSVLHHHHQVCDSDLMRRSSSCALSLLPLPP